MQLADDHLIGAGRKNLRQKTGELRGYEIRAGLHKDGSSGGEQGKEGEQRRVGRAFRYAEDAVLS